jgi:hypothetical protein
MADGARFAVIRPRQTYQALIGADRLPPWLRSGRRPAAKAPRRPGKKAARRKK